MKDQELQELKELVQPLIDQLKSIKIGEIGNAYDRVIAKLNDPQMSKAAIVCCITNSIGCGLKESKALVDYLHETIKLRTDLIPLDYLIKAFNDPSKVVIIRYESNYSGVVTDESTITKLYGATGATFEIKSVVPYSNIDEFLIDQSANGPYVYPIHSRPHTLKLPISVSDEGIHLEGYFHIDNIGYKTLLAVYKWQNNHPCGKIV